jgi:hypothetical protein
LIDEGGETSSFRCVSRDLAGRNPAWKLPLGDDALRFAQYAGFNRSNRIFFFVVSEKKNDVVGGACFKNGLNI